MHIKQGLIPTVLGTAVTATGLVLRNSIPKMYSSGIVGYGLAHIVLGSVDMIHEKDNHKTAKQFNKVLNAFK
jgi:hypothetical protein